MERAKLAETPANGVRTICFTKKLDPLRFEYYLKLKYRVFVEELGWDSVPHSCGDGIAVEDEHDEKSYFCMLLDMEGSAIGVVRGTIPGTFDQLYRNELYADALCSPEVKAVEGRVATINSLALCQAFRRHHFTSVEHSNSVVPPYSDILMSHMMACLSAAGAVAIFLSAIQGGSVALMQRLGFVRINPVHVFPSNSYSSKPDVTDLEIHDMAIALGNIYAIDTNKIKPRKQLIFSVNPWVEELDHYFNQRAKIVTEEAERR